MTCLLPQLSVVSAFSLVVIVHGWPLLNFLRLSSTIQLQLQHFSHLSHYAQLALDHLSPRLFPAPGA